MSNRRIYVLVGIVTATMFLVLFAHRSPPRPAEPTYQGKPLSYWAEQTWVQDLRGRRGVQALRAIGPEAVPFLLDDFKTPDSFLRRLYRNAWPCLPGFLQRAIGPPNPDPGENMLISHVCFNLGVLGPAAVPKLTMALNDRHLDVRLACMWTLLDLKQEAAIAPRINRLLADPNAEVRICAALALGRFQPDDTNSIPLLIDGLKGAGVRVIQVDEVRMQAAEVLGRMGPKAQAAAPELQWVYKFVGYPAMRTATSSALWRIARDTNSAGFVMTELKQAVEDGSAESYNTCDKILTAFAEVGGPPEAAPIIVSMVESPAQGLPEFTRSNLLHHGRQALTKIDSKPTGKPGGEKK